MAIVTEENSPLVEMGLGLAWLLGLAAGLQILDNLLPAASLATPILGALVVDLGATRAGLRWDLDPDVTTDASRAARRVGMGVAAALAPGLAVIAGGLALHWVYGFGKGASPSSSLGFALLRAAAVASRDELLYRGLPLYFAARAGVPAIGARAFSALAGGAAIALVPGATRGAVLLAVASGWLFATLWQRTRGAWAAVGAHAAWLLLFGSMLHGGLFDVEWTVGEITIGNGSWGPPAWIASALLVATSFAVDKIASRRADPAR